MTRDKSYRWQSDILTQDIPNWQILSNFGVVMEFVDSETAPMGVRFQSRFGEDVLVYQDMRESDFQGMGMLIHGMIVDNAQALKEKGLASITE
ncbi:hypothetical protein [Deinococcus roseus]|nr:hypothetical protein [Deinococcus roseus]